MLYACFVGEPPFGGTTPVAIAMRHLNEAVPPLRQRRPDVPEKFAAIIHRALEKDPARRFSNAGEMQQAIAATGLGTGSATDLTAAPTVQVHGTAPVPVRMKTQALDRPVGPPSSRTGRILAAITALLVVAAAVWLTAMYVQGRRPQVQTPLPTPAPTLEISEVTEEPSASPEPSPTTSAIAPGGGVGGFPEDLPVIGNNRRTNRSDDD
jgi:serine/threonine-protein kinase